MTSVVVITGSGSGIGRSIAVSLADRGWSVVATDLDEAAAAETAKLLSTAGGQQHMSRQLDVTDAAAVTAVADEIADTLGLDAWVSNAGVSFMQPFVDISLEKLDLTLAVNLKGVFLCGQAAARAMIRTGREGRIVNTASMAGKQGRVPFLADYVASKFGVVGLTQAMAFELAEHKITVNAVCPGFVATAMQERELAWEAELSNSTPEAVRDSWVAATPLGRLQQPEDVARGVAFLLSDDASFITGESLSINGGAYMD
ncbi:SDR family NAD(P)-dependent oxidoreductase [Chryseoglobus sp. 28M-23]|jgi:NAD(P)-dependent dehydrogenase (short-subunit alcohol dehydrogenase family)|uniref:SDR family NAD(P)-dependent oxidoreductase n=1 Tax=Chryseoglobus sp. 28M-23 TaxID=2772253 RepID=UPI000C3F1852|nr:SDR family NAD(P)-dependent oxidoreductase [Chryseoglobus sp. 28M-23]MBR21224.1 3-ketoacyl-ACP reductase [Leifsonia sp.]QOD94573.1 SDR family oxidoreductase [Chryseoglobus sp. 28M-23]